LRPLFLCKKNHKSVRLLTHTFLFVNQVAEKKWLKGGGVSVSSVGGGSSGSLGGGSTGLFRLKFRRPDSRSRSAGPQSHLTCSEPGGLAAASTITAADLSQLSIYQWGINEVAVWLCSLQLEEYRDDFSRHDIRGPELLTLERRDLKELGIHKVGHIKRIQQAILEIKENTRSQLHQKKSS
jgi:diacylglycerol kinase (ATP)